MSDVEKAFFQALNGMPLCTLVSSINDFTRARLREASFMRKVMPPTPLHESERDTNG